MEGRSHQLGLREATGKPADIAAAPRVPNVRALESQASSFSLESRGEIPPNQPISDRAQLKEVAQITTRSPKPRGVHIISEVSS